MCIISELQNEFGKFLLKFVSILIVIIQKSIAVDAFFVNIFGINMYQR